MAKKDDSTRTDGVTTAVPVTGEDPDVAGQPTDPDTVTPTEVSTKRNVKDSDPIPESKFIDSPPERPYEEAITDEHRAFLRESGYRI